MFGVTTFVASGVLIAGLFALRNFESSKSGRYFPEIRKKLDFGALFLVRYVFKEIPNFLYKSSQYVLLQVTHIFSASLLYVVRFMEERLYTLVRKVGGKKKDLEKSEPASNHLTDMKNHKEAVSKTIEELEEVQ